MDGGWGGLGWVIDPSEPYWANTSEDEPWVTVEVGPLQALRARDSYPRHVAE